MQAGEGTMSEKEGGIAGVPLTTSKTLFGIITKFEPVKTTAIRTEHFLRASRDVTSILDHLGTSFSLAKKDMLGNIKRIDDRFKTSPARYANLNTILDEESRAQAKPTNTALAVIWLKRALEFLRAFLSGLSREHHSLTTEENLRPTVLQAYEGTLQPYHGVMTQFLFSNISRLVPYRKDLLRTLMVDQNATIDMVIVDIDLYLPTFSDTLTLLEQLLSDCGLKSSEKV